MHNAIAPPAVSVIVVVHNQRDSFRALYQSLLHQTFPGSWELIICDDGSTPVGDVLSEGDVADNVRYVWQPHRGFRAARSRNNGIRIASGKILIFLDGDMMVPSDFLSTHVAQHDGSNTVVCGTRQTISSDSYTRPIDIAEMARRAYPDGSAHKPDPHFPWMLLFSCNFSVPRKPEVIFDERFIGWGSEDRELAIRLINLNGYSIRVCRAANAIHLVNRSIANESSNPFVTGKHEHIVALIRNKLRLRDLYPTVDLTPTLDLLLRLHLDPSTDRWSVSPHRRMCSVDEMVVICRKWLERAGLSDCPPPLGTEQGYSARGVARGS